MAQHNHNEDETGQRPGTRRQVLNGVVSVASLAYAVAQGRSDVAAAMGRLLTSRALGQPDPPGDAEVVQNFGRAEATRLKQQAQVTLQREGARLNEQLRRILGE